VAPTAPGSIWQQAQAQSAATAALQRSEPEPGFAPGMTTPSAYPPVGQMQSTPSGFVQASPPFGATPFGARSFGGSLASLGGFNPINGPQNRGMVRGLVLGLLGSLMAAFGLHLFVGGILGQASFAFDGLATTACSGPQCAVGLNSGTLGLTLGIFVVLIGFAVRSAA
jgi:hypothetical protein